MSRNSYFSAAALALAGVASMGYSQSNTINGLDVKLGGLSGLSQMGRQGAYPNGLNGLAMTTTSCNVGTVNVPWLAAMQENHPNIAFLVARERGQRMVQISDYSFCKHGFFALSSSQCTPCQNPSNGTFLGVGCSDTYSTGNNGDSFWLGPPDEIDPWNGTWTAACSHFDKGEPPVPAPQDCDGNRSLTNGMVNALGPVAHRVRVLDQDLNFENATYYYQGYYVVRAEAEALRTDNLGSKRFTPTWNAGGNFWSITTNDANITYGSILQRWSGATVTSNTNGSDDGRVYVAVKVTGPLNGVYHYEYAIHNRDNKGGVGGFRLPMPACATIANFGFDDIDTDSANNWVVTRTATEAYFTAANNNNPIKWNSFYNIWFDSNAAPSTNALCQIDEFVVTAGAASFTMPTTAPTNLPFTTFGTGTPGCDGVHNMCANSASYVGNTNFTLIADRAPALTTGLGIATDAGLASGLDSFGLGFILYNDFALATEVYSFDFNVDANGTATAAAPIANDPGLIGKTYTVDGIFLWSGPCTPSPLGISSTAAMTTTIIP